MQSPYGSGRLTTCVQNKKNSSSDVAKTKKANFQEHMQANLHFANSHSSMCARSYRKPIFHVRNFTWLVQVDLKEIHLVLTIGKRCKHFTPSTWELLVVPNRALPHSPTLSNSHHLIFLSPWKHQLSQISQMSHNYAECHPQCWNKSKRVVPGSSTVPSG